MKYYLHYVGNRLYPRDVFIKEAKEIGVNRCLPLRMMKKLKWNDKILLATYIPKEIKICDLCKGIGQIGKNPDIPCPDCQGQKLDGRKNKKHGIAKVFGYFQITGLNLNASKELKTLLTSQLNIVTTRDINTKIQRRCGSYTLGCSHIVNNSIEDITNKIQSLSNIRNEKAKVFIAGKFYDLNTSFQPINFSRTIIPIELERPLETDKDNQKEVGFILDYDKRTYIKKKKLQKV